MNIKGSWIHKTVDNIFFLYPSLFWCKWACYTHIRTTGTHTHTARPTQFLRLLLTVSRPSVWRTDVLSKGWPGRADLRLWKDNAGDRGSIRELKIRKGLDAGGEEEQRSSWIFKVSHICSSLFSTFFFPGAVQCRKRRQTNKRKLACYLLWLHGTGLNFLYTLKILHRD